MKKVDLPGNQEEIDVAPPKGKITAADFTALRNKKKKVSKKKVSEGGDHEVAMAMSSLKEIVEAAQELMSKLGGQERNIPGWIQDHITNAENYIMQASQGFHEVHGDESPEDTSLMKMMEELKNNPNPDVPSEDKITSKTGLAKKFKELANEFIPKIEGMDTKEANNLYELIKNILDKSGKGSIGTNVINTTKFFNRSTSALDNEKNSDKFKNSEAG